MVPSRACLINQKGAFSTFSNTFTAMVGHPYFAFQATGKPKATKRGRTQPGMPAPAGGGAQQQQGCRHAAGSPLCLPRSQLPQRAFVSLPPASHKQSAVLHTSPSPLARGGLGGGGNYSHRLRCKVGETMDRYHCPTSELQVHEHECV